MRISDWSSDVCSSDLRRARRAARRDRLAGRTAARAQERISYRLGPARPQEQDTMTPHSFRPWLLAAALLTLLAACDDGAPAPGAATAVPPVAVSTVTARAEAIPVVNELPGRIAPTNIAEVRPRVSGLIVERVFEQGSIVQAGDVLYRIDPAPFRVQVESAAAP